MLSLTFSSAWGIKPGEMSPLFSCYSAVRPSHGAGQDDVVAAARHAAPERSLQTFSFSGGSQLPADHHDDR